MVAIIREARSRASSAAAGSGEKDEDADARPQGRAPAGAARAGAAAGFDVDEVMRGLRLVWGELERDEDPVRHFNSVFQNLFLILLATLGGAAMILGLSRTLRSKFIMNFLTNPRIRAYEAERALKAGIDVGPRNLVLDKIIENAYRDMRVILTQLGAYGVEQTEEAVSARLAPVMEQVAPVVEEAKQQVQEVVPQLAPSQPLTAVTPGQPPAAIAPDQMTAANVERQRVMNQLAGLPA